MWTGSNVIEWVLETDTRRIFQIKHVEKQTRIKQMIYARSQEKNLELVMTELTDGQYYIPALFEANMFRDRFGLKEIKNDQCQTIVNKVLDIKSFMISACRKNKEICPYIIVLDFQVTQTTVNHQNTLESICLHDKVKAWTDRIKKDTENTSQSIFSYFEPKLLVDLFKDYYEIEAMFEFYLTQATTTIINQQSLIRQTFESMTTIPDEACIIPTTDTILMLPSPPITATTHSSPIPLTPSKVVKKLYKKRNYYSKLRSMIFFKQYDKI